MKPKFNQPCPCNSGKKYKDCHYGKENRSALSGWADVSVLDRNRILVRAARDIFGFRKGRTWAEFKRDIADEEIREFFKVHGSMWGPETNWVGIMPKPGDGKLRGLYLGDVVRPDLILRNLIRFSLYNDQILVIDPFPNARNIKPKYNPIENPGQYKGEMVKLIHFLFQIAPWIETGVVQLIPDPGDIDRRLRFETADLARARLRGIEPDAADLADTYELGRDVLKRFLFALDEKTILRQVERSGQLLSETQKRLFIEYARRELREDPIAWERPIDDNTGGQLSMMRSGVNLETALLISDITGAFPYTNMRSRWRELVGARDELSETARVWSPLANTFQSLEFKFLNNVDVGFATSIREDGRLESFRSLLRTIGKQASEVGSITALDAFVRDSKDALIGEHKKAAAEWDKIQESFVKWAGTGLTAAATGLMSGHLAVDAAALSGAVLNTIGQLGLRHMRKASFRKSNPMSVFIDLSEKESRGTTIY